jgi:hypothetical protein
MNDMTSRRAAAQTITMMKTSTVHIWMHKAKNNQNGIGYDLSHHYEDAQTITQAVSPVFINGIAGSDIVEYTKRGKQKKRPNSSLPKSSEDKGRSIGVIGLSGFKHLSLADKNRTFNNLINLPTCQ